MASTSRITLALLRSGTSRSLRLPATAAPLPTCCCSPTSSSISAPFSTTTPTPAKAVAGGKAGKGKAAPASGADEAAAPVVRKPAAQSDVTYDASNDTSSAPAGTILHGLSIYKDRPEPVARPDSHYPAWLWDIISSSSFSTDTSEASIAAETAGMSKGEARVAEKRIMKERRAAQKAKEAAAKKAQIAAEAAAAKAAAAQSSCAGVSLAGGAPLVLGEHRRIAALAADAEATQKEADAAASEAGLMPGQAAKKTGDDAATAVSGMSERELLEREKKRALRKASKSAIKTKNFVSSS